MRTHAILLLVCAFLAIGVTAAATVDAPLARLHPALRALVSSSATDNGPQSALTASPWQTDRYQLSISVTGERQIGVLVRLSQRVSARRYAGMPVLAKAGRIVALSVTISELLRLAVDPNVVYVEPSWKTRPALDQSLPAIRADLAHNAATPSLGEGVIIGTVDTGIDYEHLDFRFDGDGDGFEESTRIYAIWDQAWGLFGAEYSRSQIESDLAMGLGPAEGSVRTSDRDGHGTHVAGIAAGDGSASGSGFVGVAPEATVIAVKTSFFTADILSAVEWIFEQADELNMPAVVNLSLGGHEGPHDGTSLFEDGLDELADEPGRAIVVSAGNEGDLTIHTSGSLAGNSKSFEIVAEEWEIELSIWYPGTSSFSISVGHGSEQPYVAASGTESGYITTGHGTLFINNASSGANPNNGDKEGFVRLSNAATGDSWIIEISDLGGGGVFDAWIITPSGYIDGGDSVSTIDEPGNGDYVITVGSYNSKSMWPSLSGQQNYSGDYPVGELSSFSSRGPTRDGRTKPEICAPGAWICAAGSSNAPHFGYLTNPDGVHVMEIGSSMAAPHVAGAVALLFEKDPSLTPSEIRTILTTTAASTAQSGFVPNTRWGWGLLDVMAAIEATVSVEPPEPPVPTTKPAIELAENPVDTSARFAFSIPHGATSATLRIYTIAGALAYETAVSPTGGEYVWYLKSTRGQSLAVGLYLYVLVTDRGTSDVGRLVIER